MSEPKKARSQTTRVGPSPEALAAFYRHRSESLRGTNTTVDTAAMQEAQRKKDMTPAQEDQRGWFQRLFDALGGH